MTRSASLCALLAVFLCLPPAAWAQETRGSIEGVVKDSSGAVLPGVTLEARTARGGTATAVSFVRYTGVRPVTGGRGSARLLLGNAGQCFECSHDHAAGAAGAASRRGRLGFREACHDHGGTGSALRTGTRPARVRGRHGRYALPRTSPRPTRPASSRCRKARSSRACSAPGGCCRPGSTKSSATPAIPPAPRPARSRCVRGSGTSRRSAALSR